MAKELRSVVSGQRTAVSGQRTAVSGLWSANSGQWSTNSGQWSVVNALRSVVIGLVVWYFDGLVALWGTVVRLQVRNVDCCVCQFWRIREIGVNLWFLLEIREI